MGRDLLDTIDSAVDGTVDGLGEAVRTVTPGGGAETPPAGAGDAAGNAGNAAAGS